MERYEAYRASRFFAGLDGLRALSILAVIGDHCEPPGQLTMPLFAHGGYYGVSLFFAISGFLITTLLLREYDETGAIDLKAFYARRTLRIFPLYYATLLLYIVIIHIVDPSSDRGHAFYAGVPYFLTYTSNWFVPRGGGHFSFAWSLATEEQFYLLWAPVMALVERKAALFLMLLALLAGVMGEHVVHFFSFTWLQVNVLTTIPPAMCLGCLLAFALHDRRGFDTLSSLLGGRWSGVFILSSLATVLWVNPLNADLVFVLMALLVASVCTAPDGLLTRWLSLAPLAWVGKISYGMYLLHGICLTECGRWTLDRSWFFFTTVVLVTVGVSTLSYRCFESPFLRLKQRFQSRQA